VSERRARPPGVRRDDADGTGDPTAPAGATDRDDFPVVDGAVVDSLRRLGARSGRDVLAELTALFLTTSDAQVRAAEDLLTTRDLPELARVAHALKGSSSVIGARRVAASALALEDSCGLTARGVGSGSITQARQALARFVEELQRYRSALADLGIGGPGDRPAGGSGVG
jgi:HPt (histidine-containing phosphotransfer) domain-containing protein